MYMCQSQSFTLSYSFKYVLSCQFYNRVIVSLLKWLDMNCHFHQTLCNLFISCTVTVFFRSDKGNFFPPVFPIFLLTVHFVLNSNYTLCQYLLSRLKFIKVISNEAIYMLKRRKTLKIWNYIGTYQSLKFFMLFSDRQLTWQNLCRTTTQVE